MSPQRPERPDPMGEPATMPPGLQAKVDDVEADVQTLQDTVAVGDRFFQIRDTVQDWLDVGINRQGLQPCSVTAYDGPSGKGWELLVTDQYVGGGDADTVQHNGPETYRARGWEVVDEDLV